MGGLSRTGFDEMKAELELEWSKAVSRDDGLKVIVNFGQRFGYKNVMAALQGREPKRLASGIPVEQWVKEQRAEESAEPSADVPE